MSMTAEDIRQEMEKHRKMRAMCKDYVRKPIALMTANEVLLFADEMTETTSRTLRIAAPERKRHRRRLNIKEKESYRAAVFNSIAYFNRRDEEHQRHMQYLVELRAAREEREAREMRKKTKTKNITVHIL